MPREALAEILCAAEIGGSLVTTSPRPPLDEIRYVPCPLCHTTMNRVNFGKVSGVIVDVCKAHGTWFDVGELTRIVAFAASGGLEKTRAREEAGQREERVADVRARTALLAMKVEGFRDRHRADEWNDFLNLLFRW